jgi:hypothetical protein
MQRFIACFLIALSPGLESYQAFAGGIGRAPVRNISLPMGQVGISPARLAAPLNSKVDANGVSELIDTRGSDLTLPTSGVQPNGFTLNGAGVTVKAEISVAPEDMGQT